MLAKDVQVGMRFICQKTRSSFSSFVQVGDIIEISASQENGYRIHFFMYKEAGRDKIFDVTNTPYKSSFYPDDFAQDFLTTFLYPYSEQPKTNTALSKFPQFVPVPIFATGPVMIKLTSGKMRAPLGSVFIAKRLSANVFLQKTIDGSINDDGPIEMWSSVQSYVFREQAKVIENCDFNSAILPEQFLPFRVEYSEDPTNNIYPVTYATGFKELFMKK